MESVLFWFRFHWNLFPRVQLALSHDWFRLDNDLLSLWHHYLNQWWPSLMTHLGITGHQWVNWSVPVWTNSCKFVESPHGFFTEISNNIDSIFMEHCVRNELMVLDVLKLHSLWGVLYYFTNFCNLLNIHTLLAYVLMWVLCMRICCVGPHLKFCIIDSCVAAMLVQYYDYGFVGKAIYLSPSWHVDK